MRSNELTVEIVETVAVQEGVSPTEVDQRLSSVVDLGSLESLFVGDQGRLCFEYSGYNVTVTASGEVSATPK